jgi:hypothetical protein
VYGLLALIGDVSDLDLWLTPNYTKFEHEVFYDATCAMLHRDISSLKCLTGAQNGVGLKKWASWVRDFGVLLTQIEADIGSNRLMLYDLFDASEGSKSRYKHYMTWTQLADEKPYQVGLGLQGKRVGTVASVCAEIMGGGSEEDVQARKHVYKEWIDVSKVDLNHPGTDQPYSESATQFWRTILGGVMSAGKESTEYSDWRKFSVEATSWIENFLSWMRDGQTELHFALDRTLLIATDGRCYFRTEGGGQGLCYPSAKVGDEVWVIKGSKVPFVLRRVQLSDDERVELRPREAYGVDDEGVFGLKEDFEAGDETLGYCNLVGDCYFDGCMHGEMAEDTTQPLVLV